MLDNTNIDTKWVLRLDADEVIPPELAEEMAEEMSIHANDDAVRSVKVVLGVLANAVCESNNLPTVDYVTEDESVTKAAKEIKVETKVVELDDFSEEEIKEAKKEKVEAEKEEVASDYSKMTVAELKKLAKEKGISGYSTMKKDELISSLN